MATSFGRPSTRVLVYFIAGYYALFDRKARHASRQWLRVVCDHPVRFRHVHRHLRHFAQVTFDRLFFLRGKLSSFRVTRTGNEHLLALVKRGQGAVLLGAHLGSFEALRAAGEDESFPVHIVGHFERARMINALLSDANATMAARVLHIGSDPIALALRLRAAVEEGSMVAMLGDRVGLVDKTVEVRFFGRLTRFPAGPFLLASVLKCPVLLTFGIYREPNRYDLFCEPFADAIVLSRGQRQEALVDIVQRFANRLEAKARAHPYNWFNFYDIWTTQRGAEKHQ